MIPEPIRRPPRKGIEIRPHKGGRTERLYARVEPAIKEELTRQLSERGISLADWITLMVKEGKILKD